MCLEEGVVLFVPPGLSPGWVVSSHCSNYRDGRKAPSSSLLANSFPGVRAELQLCGEESQRLFRWWCSSRDDRVVLMMVVVLVLMLEERCIN